MVMMVVVWEERGCRPTSFHASLRSSDVDCRVGLDFEAKTKTNLFTFELGLAGRNSRRSAASGGSVHVPRHDTVLLLLCPVSSHRQSRRNVFDKWMIKGREQRFSLFFLYPLPPFLDC